MKKERERQRGLIEEGKREQESKGVHVIPECCKFKAQATHPLAGSLFLSIA